MNTVKLSFTFSTGTFPELLESQFLHPRLEAPRRCVRGRTQGAFFGRGSFEWSRAVRALSLLVAQAKLATITSEQPQISGNAGSLAASLDYALDKQPNWMIEMFGCDVHGRTLLRTFVARSNTGRKRPGPVTLAIRPASLGNAIEIIIDERPLRTAHELHTVVDALKDPETPIRKLLVRESERLAA